MSRMVSFSSPLMLGFDDIERLADRVGKTATDGYPPYNIERLTADGQTMLRITLAVAGFSEDDLDITVEDRQLHVRGHQTDDGEREYLHRGIAARQFHRAFVLADGMEVSGADLNDGLLGIELIRHEPEQVIKRIDISTGRGAAANTKPTRNR